jgi:hypothetical protein
MAASSVRCPEFSGRWQEHYTARHPPQYSPVLTHLTLDWSATESLLLAVPNSASNCQRRRHATCPRNIARATPHGLWHASPNIARAAFCARPQGRSTSGKAPSNNSATASGKDVLQKPKQASLRSAEIASRLLASSIRDCTLRPTCNGPCTRSTAPAHCSPGTAGLLWPLHPSRAPTGR